MFSDVVFPLNEIVHTVPLSIQLQQTLRTNNTRAWSGNVLYIHNYRDWIVHNLFTDAKNDMSNNLVLDLTHVGITKLRNGNLLIGVQKNNRLYEFDITKRTQLMIHYGAFVISNCNVEMKNGNIMYCNSKQTEILNRKTGRKMLRAPGGSGNSIIELHDGRFVRTMKNRLFVLTSALKKIRKTKYTEDVKVLYEYKPGVIVVQKDLRGLCLISVDTMSLTVANSRIPSRLKFLLRHKCGFDIFLTTVGEVQIYDEFKLFRTLPSHLKMGDKVFETGEMTIGYVTSDQKMIIVNIYTGETLFSWDVDGNHIIKYIF